MEFDIYYVKCVIIGLEKRDCMKKLNLALKNTKSNKKDKEFGEIIYILKNTSFPNILSPAIIILIGSLFIFYSNTMMDSDAFLVVGVIILLVGLYILGNFLFDRLYFYENGMVESSILNANKVRIPYQKIKTIQLEKRNVKKMKTKNQTVCYKLLNKENQILFEVEQTSYQNLKKVMEQIRNEFKRKDSL